MSNIRIDLDTAIFTGQQLTFRSPVDCSAITGLVVYHLDASGSQTSSNFQFTDAHGCDVGNIDHLFSADVIVKVILDVEHSKAYVQNADTNTYLENALNDKVKKSGGVMTGNIIIQRANWPTIALQSTEGHSETALQNDTGISTLFTRNVVSESSNMRLFRVKSSAKEANVSKAVELIDVVGGVYNYYDLLHTGNKEQYVSFKTTATIPANWTKRTDGGIGYSQTLNIAGIKKADDPIIALAMTGSQATNETLMEAWNLVTHIATYDGTVILYCYGEAPAVALPILIQCIR